jgi:hypothetical protein
MKENAKFVLLTVKKWRKNAWTKGYFSYALYNHNIRYLQQCARSGESVINWPSGLP